MQTVAVILTSGFVLSAPPARLVHTPVSASPYFALVMLSLRRKPKEVSSSRVRKGSLM